MNQRKEDWRDSRHVMGLSAGWAVFGVVLVLLIVGAIWGGSVLLSNITGSGNAIKQNQSAGNRIEQQAHFEDLAAEFDGYTSKITLAKQGVKDASTTIDKQIAATNLQGIQQACIDTAQEFNAASRKYLARDWKSAGLPATLDRSVCTS